MFGCNRDFGEGSFPGGADHSRSFFLEGLTPQTLPPTKYDSAGPPLPTPAAPRPPHRCATGPQQFKPT